MYTPIYPFRASEVYPRKTVTSISLGRAWLRARWIDVRQVAWVLGSLTGTFGIVMLMFIPLSPTSCSMKAAEQKSEPTPLVADLGAPATTSQVDEDLLALNAPVPDPVDAPPFQEWPVVPAEQQQDEPLDDWRPSTQERFPVEPRLDETPDPEPYAREQLEPEPPVRRRNLPDPFGPRPAELDPPPIDDRPIDDRSIDERSIDERSIDDRSIDDRSIDERSIGERPPYIRPIDEPNPFDAPLGTTTDGDDPAEQTDPPMTPDVPIVDQFPEPDFAPEREPEPPSAPELVIEIAGAPHDPEHIPDVDDPFESVSTAITAPVDAPRATGDELWTQARRDAVDAARPPALYLDRASRTELQDLARSIDAFTDDAAASLSPDGGALDGRIEIEKIAPETVTLNATARYELVVRNPGERRLDRVVVEELVPGNVDLVDVDPPAAYDDGRIRWLIRDLDSGELRRLTVEVLPREEGEFQSRTLARAYTAVETKTQVDGVKLRLEVLPPERVKAGGDCIVRFKVKNVGEIEAEDVEIHCDLSDELSHKHGRRLNFCVGKLAPGQTRRTTMLARAETAGSAIHDARLVADGRVFDESKDRINVVGPGSPTVPRVNRPLRSRREAGPEEFNARPAPTLLPAVPQARTFPRPVRCDPCLVRKVAAQVQ